MKTIAVIFEIIVILEIGAILLYGEICRDTAIMTKAIPFVIMVFPCTLICYAIDKGYSMGEGLVLIILCFIAGNIKMFMDRRK